MEFKHAMEKFNYHRQFVVANKKKSAEKKDLNIEEE